MKVLIPNIGSTSFKYRLLEMPETAEPARLRRPRRFWPRAAWSGSASRAASAPITRPRFASASAEIAGPGKALESLSEIGAVGFKAVHDGPAERAAVRSTTSS